MHTSDSVNELIPSLIAAQSKFTNLGKDKQGHNYKYVELPNIVDMIRPILAENGLAITQGLKTTDDSLSIETRLYHKSGQFIADEIKLFIDKGKMNSMQSLGSAITYARRYGLQNILCIVGEDDDDGASSGQRFQQKNGHNIPQQKMGQSSQPTQNANNQIDYKSEFLKVGTALCGKDVDNWAAFRDIVNYDKGVIDQDYWRSKLALAKKVTKDQISVKAIDANQDLGELM